MGIGTVQHPKKRFLCRRMKRLLNKSEKQIPRGLKPPRDDKNKGLVRRS
jgi:hypothetical protein